MRCHKGTTKCPKRKTTQADNPSPEDPHNPDNRHKHGGTAPVTWRCTRYVAVHPNRRGALPTDRVQCPNIQEQTRNWHTEPLTAAPLHAQLGPTGGRMGTPPTPPPALRPTPTPPTPLNAKSRFYSGCMLPTHTYDLDTPYKQLPLPSVEEMFPNLRIVDAFDENSNLNPELSSQSGAQSGTQSGS